MPIKIQSNIPLPIPRGKAEALGIPWHILKVGDSFEIDVSFYKTFASARGSIMVLAARHGVRVVSRRVSEKTLRFWCVPNNAKREGG